MIRRNSIQQHVSADKYNFKYRPKNRPEETSKGEYQIELSIEEKALLISNNKKYRQYKEERQIKKKNGSQSKDENLTVRPLGEIDFNIKDINNNAENKPKRQEKVDIKQPFESWKSSWQPHRHNDIIRAGKQEIRARDYRKYSKKDNSENISSVIFDQKKPYQSNKKYSSIEERVNTKLFTPYFEQTNFLTEQKNDYKNNQRRIEHFSMDYDKVDLGDQFSLKIDYENRQQHLKNIKIKSDNNIIDRSFNSMTVSKPPQLFAHNFRIHSSEEQVCLKLKQISQFNQEINERIKNIIGGFQHIKNHL